MESKLNVTNLTSSFPCTNASQSWAPECILTMMYPSQSAIPAPSSFGELTLWKWIPKSTAIKARPNLHCKRVILTGEQKLVNRPSALTAKVIKYLVQLLGSAEIGSEDQLIGWVLCSQFMCFLTKFDGCWQSIDVTRPRRQRRRSSV